MTERQAWAGLYGRWLIVPVLLSHTILGLAAPHHLNTAGASYLRVYQRTTTALPGSDGQLLLTIDDITGGQTLTSLEWRDGERVAGPRSLSTGGSVEFVVDGQRWRLRMTLLHNELIGNDWAEFVLEPAASVAAQPESEIDALILAIDGLEQVQFIRNGQSYTAHEAAQHLRQKWRAAGAQIRSAEDFISGIASQSSSTGEPYLLRFPDGRTVSAQLWLTERLQQMR